MELDETQRTLIAAIDNARSKILSVSHSIHDHPELGTQNFVDKMISSGKISKTLPGIKKVAMEVLYPEYSTKDSAFLAISEKISAFYSSNYPDLATSKKADIATAIVEIQNGYAKNIFPYMKASWKSYPNNIGHMEFDGCFRCHNDRHASQSGKVISRDCNLCHNILAQGTPDSMEYSKAFEPLEFKHPVDIDEAWKTELCSSCHSQLY